MDKEKIWKSVLAEMELALPPMIFATWFKGTELFDIDNHVARIKVQNIFSRDWIKAKYRNNILEAIQKSIPEIKEVVLFVGNNVPEKEILNIPPAKKIRAEKPDALETPNNLKEDYTFESFVVGNNNSLAFAVAKELAKSPGLKHNPFFIYGGVGLGKTHLAQAIGNEILKNKSDAKINYVSCETFTNDYIAAIAAKKMDSFKKRYRDVDVLIVDDIQFLSNKEGSQEEFFHTFNSLHQKKRQIIMTADKVPQAIPALEDRLASRFGGGTVVDMQAPNLETRIAILGTKCQEMDFFPPTDVLSFIAENIKSNVRELEGALNRVYNHCHYTNATPTVELAKKALGDVLSSSNKKISSAQVIKVICDFFSIDKKDLLGKSRKQDLIVPRHIAVYLIRKNSNESFPLIGKIMGGKDHSTILHSFRKIENDLLTDESLKRDIDEMQEILNSSN